MLLLVSVYSAVVHPVAIYNIRAGSGEIMGRSLGTWEYSWIDVQVRGHRIDISSANTMYRSCEWTRKRIVAHRNTHSTFQGWLTSVQLTALVTLD